MQMFLEPRLRNSEEETKTRAQVEAAEKIIPGLEQCRGEWCSAPRNWDVDSVESFLTLGPPDPLKSQAQAAFLCCKVVPL